MRPLYAHAEPPMLGWLAAPHAIPDAIARGVAELEILGSDLTAGAGLVIDLATVGLGAAVVVTDDRGVAVEVPALEVPEGVVAVVGVQVGSVGHDANVTTPPLPVTTNENVDRSSPFAGEAA